VQERSRQVRRRASPETDEQRAAKAQRRRRLWSWIDEETGESCGKWRLPGAVGAELVAELNRRAQPFFEAGRRSGDREELGAYMADALAEAFRQPAATPWARPPAAPAGAVEGDAAPDGDPDQAGKEPKLRSRRDTTVLYRVDGTAADRGHTLPGERCEIPGTGPVPLDEVLALGGTDAAKVVVVTDPDDHTRIQAIATLGHTPLPAADLMAHLRRVVTDRGVDVAALVHDGRKPTAAQVSAVMWLSGGRCQIRGCTSGTGRLEIDHVDPWATSGHTTLHHLALLCGHCHDLKTHQGWTVGLLRPDGKRDLAPPDRPAGPDPPDTG